jgi:hypothetical protein
MLIAFLPNASFAPVWNMQLRSDLLFISMIVLWYHSVYSFYKFYGLSWQQVYDEKIVKQISLLLGSVGQVVISLGYYGYCKWSTVLIPAATFLGVSHFWTMEIDFAYKLQVRPYAYLPLYLAPVVILLLAYTQTFGELIFMY